MAEDIFAYHQIILAAMDRKIEEVKKISDEQIKQRDEMIKKLEEIELVLANRKAGIT